MTNRYKTGDKVKLATNTPHARAFTHAINKGLLGKGSTLIIKRVERNGKLLVKAEEVPEHMIQIVRVSDIEPIPQEPQQPSAPMTVKVLQLLQAKGSLTALEAGGVLKCRMLPYQIHQLRNLGWKIRTEHKKDPIDNQRYARYHIVDSVAA